jgi:hypothetical protein
LEKTLPYIRTMALLTRYEWSPTVGIIGWLYPLMQISLLVFLWLTLRGYMAFGVTDKSVRDGLLASLANLNLPFEETLSAVRLRSLGADLQVAVLQVAVQSWIGTGQIKMKQRQFNEDLRAIVKGMNNYYRNSEISNANLTCCIFYVIIGLALTALTVAMILKSGQFK